jgi:proteasome lid subunit RPN8/RPN11
MRAAIVLPEGVRRSLVAHARRERPRECCGLLLGHGARVQFALPMRNVADDAQRHYALDPRQHIDIRRALRGLVPALEIVGVYHSHPAGRAEPSPTDIVEACYPEWVHVIVGLGAARQSVRAFHLADGRARPVRLAAPSQGR